jgi:hypothetical protein
MQFYLDEDTPAGYSATRAVPFPVLGERVGLCKRVRIMSNNFKDQLPRDVHELLLNRPDEQGKQISVHEILDTRKDGEKRKFFTVPVIVVLIVILLSGIGIAYIMADDIRAEQFNAMMHGELGKYKESLRKAQEDRIRDIEAVTGNKYGSLTLFYSPKTARVSIKEFKYTQDCSQFTDEIAILTCLKKATDYSQTPETREVDNPSLHLDKEKKEIIEQIPLNDIPIQESNDERNTIYRYEYEIQIEADGYHPRYFFITGDSEHRKDVENWVTLFWDMKGPGLYMADFQGADLMPTAETAKENYKKALMDIECIRREIEAKRKEGKTITDDTVQGLEIELLNRNGFKTSEEFRIIDQELRKDEEFFAAFQKELASITCK